MKLFVIFNTILYGFTILIYLLLLGFNPKWPIILPPMKQLDYARKLMCALALLLWGVWVLLR